MKLYKKCKKEFVEAELSSIKVGDIVKLKSDKDNKFIIEPSFITKVNDGNIILQSSKSNYRFDGIRCTLV